MGRMARAVFLKFGLRASNKTDSSSRCHQAEPIRTGGRGQSENPDVVAEEFVLKIEAVQIFTR